MRRPYPFQLANVEWLLTQKVGFILDEPGLGKSVTSALLIEREAGRGRWLVVAPASVRAAWTDRLTEWAPSVSHARIAQGPRKSDSGPEKMRQEVLRTADVLITSYDLVHEFVGTRFLGIILDEIHELVSYRAKVRKVLADLIYQCAPQYVVGLTATPMTAEPKNTANVLDLFWPGLLGKFSKSGEPPHKFVSFYGVPKESEWATTGYTYSGLRPDRAGMFKAMLGERSRRTLREQVSDLLPKVDFRPLVIEHEDKRPQASIVVERVDIMTAETAHVAVFTRHQEKALEIYNKLASLPRYQGKTLIYLDGRVEAGARLKIIQEAAKSEASVLVGTIGALGTGIDLTHVGQYLVAEAIKTAHLLTQLDGRFRRLSSLNRAPTIGWALYREGQDDDVRQAQIDRMKAYTSMVEASMADKALLETLEANNDTSMDRILDILGSSFRGGTEDEELDDGDV